MPKSRKKLSKPIEQSTKSFDLYNVNPKLRSSLLPYVKIKFDNGIKRRALIDTGACANVVSNRLLQELTEIDKNLVEINQPDCTSVKMAGGQIVRIEKQAEIKFKLAHREFVEDFLVLSSTNSVILGNPFFIKHDISISPKQGLIQFPDLTVQINEIKPVNEKRRAVGHKKIPIYTNKKHTIQPNEQIFLECYLPDKTDQFENKSGVITPNEILEETEIALTSSLSTVGRKNTLYVSALNVTEHPITINSRTEVGRFSILSAEQADRLIQIDPQLIALAKSRNKDDYFTELNQLIQDFTQQKPGQTKRPPPEYSKLWFPTPETCEDPSNLPFLQQEIYDQILNFQKLEQIDPQNNEEYRKFILSKFNCENFSLSHEQINECENLLVEYCDIFAKHRFDVGYNTELKIS